MLQLPPRIFDRDIYRLHHARMKADVKNNRLLAQLEESIHERAAIFAGSYERALFYNSPGLNYRAINVKVADFANLTNAASIYDEETILARGEYDLIVSMLSLGMVNDLPGALSQYRKLLKPKGVFFGTLYGGQTLIELREVFARVDSKYFSGMSPRISPMVDIKDAAALLQRARFINPVADAECIRLEFKDIFELMHFIKDMGQSNCLYIRNKQFPPKNYFGLVADEYAKDFTKDCLIRATFEIITMTGRG